MDPRGIMESTWVNHEYMYLAFVTAITVLSETIFITDVSNSLRGGGVG